MSLELIKEFILFSLKNLISLCWLLSCLVALCCVLVNICEKRLKRVIFDIVMYAAISGILILIYDLL